MSVLHNAVLLRLFMGENDRYGRQPLYEAVVLKARELGLAGATVLRGPLGFGASSALHTAKILRLSEDLPMVIEIVDTEERIQTLVGALGPMLAAGSTLVTLERVQVVRYGREDAAPFS
jgi:PII-like signaling protein